MSRSSYAVQSMGYGMLLAVSTSLFPGCAVEEDDAITPGAEVINHTTQALAMGKIQSIEGSYLNCRNRLGRWSLRVEEGAVLNAPELSVLKNDRTCTLAIEKLVAEQTYEASPAITLAADFAGMASAFAPVVDGKRQATTLYANAKITSEAFSSGFNITVVYSDDITLTESSAPSTSSAVKGSAEQVKVAAPDYTPVFENVEVVENGVYVESASGAFYLKEGVQAGETFVVVQSDLGSSFEEIQAHYLKGTKHKVASEIDVAVLELPKAMLPVHRSLIIAHEESGVTAYQVVRISF